jgi:hypothetical protein
MFTHSKVPLVLFTYLTSKEWAKTSSLGLMRVHSKKY